MPTSAKVLRTIALILLFAAALASLFSLMPPFANRLNYSIDILIATLLGAVIFLRVARLWRLLP